MDQQNIKQLNANFLNIKTLIFSVWSVIDVMTYPCNWKYRTLLVQRTNIIPIHRSFPCLTKGLFYYECHTGNPFCNIFLDYKKLNENNLNLQMHFQTEQLCHHFSNIIFSMCIEWIVFALVCFSFNLCILCIPK